MFWVMFIKKNYGWGNFYGLIFFLGIEGVYGDLK